MNDSTPRSARWRSRPLTRVIVPVAAVTVLVALVALTVNVTGTGVGGRHQESSPSTVPLTEAGRELLGALRQARTATFHGRYTATASELSGAAIRVETWRRPPRLRQDTEIVQDEQIQRSRLLLLDNDALQCVQAGEGAWACRRLDQAQAQAADPILDEVAEQVPVSRVTVRDEMVRGDRARCFTLVARERSTEFCVNRESIPVRVSSRGLASRGITLELAELGRDVPDGAFIPPAPPS